MTFGSRLREARLRRGLTQEQLAQEIGVAKSTLTGYEKGNREPDIAKIKRLLETLRIDAAYLFETEGAPLAGETEEFRASYELCPSRGANDRTQGGFACETELVALFGGLRSELQAYLLLMTRELLLTQRQIFGPLDGKEVAAFPPQAE